MKKILVKKISGADIDALASNSIKEVILSEVKYPTITYNAETKEIVFGNLKYSLVSIFTTEEIAEFINEKNHEGLKDNFLKVEDCGEYFEVTDFETLEEYRIFIDGEVENGVLHTNGKVESNTLIIE